MANLFLALILITVIILIVGATADVRFTYTDSLAVTIDFLFFTLILRSNKKGTNGNGKSTFIEKAKKNLRKTKAKKAALASLLKNSALTVHDINIPIKNKEPSQIATDSANISSLILIIFTYLSMKAHKISIQDESFLLLSDSRDKNIPTLDFTVRTTVYSILCSSLIYFVKGI